MDLISIIVPIYKVEQYLHRCIDSILMQTYSNFELILVDDGSPDKCPLICDEYAAKDRRIKVIHKENGGLSDARNAGLSIAKGEYIVFIDSDDWVSSKYLELLLDSCNRAKVNICECGIIYTSGAVKEENLKIDEINTYSTEEALKFLIEDQQFHQYVWNKIYRRSVIKDIRFPKGKTNEDEFWTYQVFGNAERIAYIGVPLYYYFQRNDSIMGKKYSIKRLDCLEAKLQRNEYIKIHYPSLIQMSKLNFMGSCIYAGQMVLLCLQGAERKMAKKLINSAMKSCNVSIWECSQAAGNNKVWYTLASLFFWSTCRIKNILKKGL